METPYNSAANPDSHSTASRLPQRNRNRDIEGEFQHLLAVMEQYAFRHGEGIAGEQQFYIYDYPPERQLEVEEHLPRLIKALQTMQPQQPDDYAPSVCRVDLYDVVLGILRKRGILEKVLKAEPRYHTVVSSNSSQDKFLSMLDSILGADTKQLPEAVRQAGDNADILFITGVGAVYPYVRAHTLLNTLQGLVDGKPVVLFYPGTFQTSATVGSTLTLFGCLQSDNYYRAMRIRYLDVPGETPNQAR